MWKKCWLEVQMASTRILNIIEKGLNGCSRFPTKRISQNEPRCWSFAWKHTADDWLTMDRILLTPHNRAWRENRFIRQSHISLNDHGPYKRNYGKGQPPKKVSIDSKEQTKSGESCILNFSIKLNLVAFWRSMTKMALSSMAVDAVPCLDSPLLPSMQAYVHIWRNITVMEKVIFAPHSFRMCPWIYKRCIGMHPMPGEEYLGSVVGPGIKFLCRRKLDAIIQWRSFYAIFERCVLSMELFSLIFRINAAIPIVLSIFGVRMIICFLIWKDAAPGIKVVLFIIGVLIGARPLQKASSIQWNLVSGRYRKLRKC